jgi:GWxTD domain-containing protein
MVHPLSTRGSFAGIAGNVLGLILVASLVATPARAADNPLATTFLAAKEAYKAKRYEEADARLKEVLELLAAPERATARPRILPAYHFYAAASAWGRHDEARSREHLRSFFDLSPDATIDAAAYPKSFCIAFEAAKEEAGKRTASTTPSGGPAAIGGNVLPAFSGRDVEASAVPVNDGAANWVDSAVSALLLDSDVKAWKKLVDESDRRAFVEAFWKRFDPDPATPENEFQLEFYRRVQYCEAAFSTEQTRGALSDRAKVFLVLGPPTFAGRTPLKRTQDVMNYLRSTETVVVQTKPVGAPGSSTVMLRVPSDRSSVTPGEIEGEIETWYYRKGRVPKGLPFAELQFQFITRSGYGSWVLQREPRTLNALRKAARLLASEHQRD